MFGIVVEINNKRKWFRHWCHKLFRCPTFWRSFFGKCSHCPCCNRKIRCYWDGNDINGKIDVCMHCFPSEERKEAIQGLIRVHEANMLQFEPCIDGDCPKCKNAVGTWLCERCGRDVRDNFDTACPAIPVTQRWRVKYT